MITKRLLELRERAGISQNEIAKRLRIARTTYASYEQGAREPDLEMLNKLSNLHGVSIDFLLGKESEKGTTYAIPESEFEKFVKEREELYGVTVRDDPVFRAALRALVDSIAQTKLEEQKKNNPE